MNRVNLEPATCYQWGFFHAINFEPKTNEELNHNMKYIGKQLENTKQNCCFQRNKKENVNLSFEQKKNTRKHAWFYSFPFCSKYLYFLWNTPESTSNVLKRFRTVKVLYKVLPQFTFTNGKIIIYSKVIELYFSEFITLQESEFKRIYNHCSRHCVDKYTPFRKINCLIQTFMAVRIFVELNRKKS